MSIEEPREPADIDGEPEGVDFSEPAKEAAPAPRPVKAFTWFIIGLVGASIVLLVMAMVNNVTHFFG